jgi:hypothetical protein
MDGSERYHGVFFITIDCISVMGGSAQMENLRIRTLNRENIATKMIQVPV